jgi:hypothetical protein
MLPIKAKYLVIIYMAVEVFAVMSQSQTGVAHVAHLGGAVVGALYVQFILKRSRFKFTTFKDSSSNVFDNFKDMFEKKKDEPQSTGKVYDAKFEDINRSKYEDDMKREERERQETIDAILDKLSAKGYSSLTEEEKRILFQESKRR